METIIEYIAADSPRYAAIFAKRIMQVVRTIPANPEMGCIVPEYRDSELR